MSNVIVETEMSVVYPDCMVLYGDEVKLLAIPGNQMQVAFGCLLDARKVDSSV
jgi:hypothetical protein